MQKLHPLTVIPHGTRFRVHWAPSHGEFLSYFEPLARFARNGREERSVGRIVARARHYWRSTRIFIRLGPLGLRHAPMQGPRSCAIPPGRVSFRNALAGETSMNVRSLWAIILLKGVLSCILVKRDASPPNIWRLARLAASSAQSFASSKNGGTPASWATQCAAPGG